MDYEIKTIHIRFVVDFDIGLPDGMTEEEYEDYIKDFSMETDLDEGSISLADYTSYEEYQNQ